MSKNAKVSGSVVAGFPSPMEQYQETSLDLNELLVKGPPPHSSSRCRASR